MDYFNFEEASHAIPPLDLDMPSIEAELPVSNHDADGKADSVAYPNPVTNDKNYGQAITLRFINNRAVEGILWDHHDGTDFPLYRAKESCALCARMGLDCFIASRGALITGCTCCISLFRECSFTHPLPPKGYIPTMSGIAEDTQMCQGTTLESRPPMKSFEDAKGRKTGARFPRDAVKILKRWLSEHADHPYPNEREKDELKQLTGLKKSQIANWLANARRRGKAKLPSGPSSPMLGAIDIPGALDYANLNPMDRWRASPPENEPAKMTDIARAVSAAPQSHSTSVPSLHNSRTSSKKASSEDGSNWSAFRAPTVSSFETKESSNSDFSFASSHSHRSKASKVSQSSAERRRRRRAPMTQRAVAQATKSRSARIFQCTFCTDTFPAKYDWQRHEKSLHLALERWVCCPTGGTVVLDNSDQKQCAFCSEVNPDEAHLETHNFSACFEKSVQERTFYRKDHLRQHLKLTHATKFHASMEGWKFVHNEIKSRCGFCSEVFSTWQQRADHLSVHFRNGADMTNWTGDWGLDPEIERCVDNAIPPYLIGADRLSVNPYVARVNRQRSTGGQTGSITPAQPALSHGSSPHEDALPPTETFDPTVEGLSRFEQDYLVGYVNDQLRKGKSPTDREIQDFARTAIYGCPDPLDWTHVDHEAYLNAFKDRMGLNNALASIDTSIPLSGHSSQGPDTPIDPDFDFAALTATGSGDFDADMQIDFDANDFASLNLDDLAQLEAHHGTINGEFDSSGFASDTLTMHYTPAAKQQLRQATFDPFDMSFDMPIDTTAKSTSAATAADNGFEAMSAQHLDQLTQYMAGFSAKKF